MANGAIYNEEKEVFHIHDRKLDALEDLIEGAIGAKYDGYDRAVDSHIKNLRQKIEDNPKSPKYIVTQYGVGYKFAGTKI